MKKVLFKLMLVCIGLALIISGCAKKPTEELERAEQALNQAKEAGAPEWAAESYQTAENKLGEGKSLIDSKNYKDAKPALEEAAHLAEKAAQEAVTAKKEAELKKQEEAEQEEEPLVVKTDHVVVKGECLWFIAGYDDVYGDHLKWPQIYQANKDKINDPNLIFPNQVLDIPR